MFLDRICINQANKNMKTEAILSLAGLLRKSDTMLILWDPSWTTRLWCLFLGRLMEKKPAIVSRLVYRSEKTGLSLLTYLPYTYNLGLWLLISDLLNGVRHQLGLFFLVASFIFIKADFQRVLPPQTSSKLLKPMGSRVSLTLEYIYKVLQCGAPQL